MFNIKRFGMLSKSIHRRTYWSAIKYVCIFQKILTKKYKCLFLKKIFMKWHIKFMDVLSSVRSAWKIILGSLISKHHSMCYITKCYARPGLANLWHARPKWQPRRFSWHAALSAVPIFFPDKPCYITKKYACVCDVEIVYYH